MDIVIISSLNGVEPGMGLALHRKDIKNRNIIRQYFIQSEQQVKVPCLLNIRMKEELTGVHPGVGAAATNYCNLFFQQFAHRIFKHILYTLCAGMFLPATVSCAMIGYMEKISQSGCCKLEIDYNDCSMSSMHRQNPKLARISFRLQIFYFFNG